MNKVVLSGNTTKDIELRELSNGTKVCNFTLAVKRPYTEDTTDFFNCIAWRSTAEYLSKYATKGVKVGIVGTLINRDWEDEKGEKHARTEINVESAEIYTVKGKEEKAELEPITDDKLPF